MSKITNSKLHDLFKLAQQQAIDANIPIGDIDPNITVNERANSFWGRCHTTYTNNKKIHKIEVSKSLLYANDHDILTTLMHEILHTCEGCQNHGDKWKHYAAIVKRKYGYNVKRTTSAEEKHLEEPPRMEKKYCLECKRCGKKFYYAKMCGAIRSPQSYRCHCKGELVRIK